MSTTASYVQNIKPVHSALILFHILYISAVVTTYDKLELPQ